MDDEKVDLSPLDPARDELAWERRIASVAARGLAARKRTLSVSDQLRVWQKPALAVAAALAAASWLGVIAGERFFAEPETRESAELTWSRWALNDEVPQTAELFEVMEASHER